MKIAFITFEYPPFIQGGAGAYGYNLTKELVKLGHEVHVITPRVFEPEGASEEGLFVHRLSFINKPLLAATSFWLSLRKEFPSLEQRFGGFDIIHGNAVSDLSLSRKAAHSSRVVTVHHLARTAAKMAKAGLVDRVKEASIVPFLEPICIKRADRIIADSQYTKLDTIKTYGLPESRIEVIYLGVHPSDYIFPEEEKAKLRATLGINLQPLVLFVGRLETRKGVDILLKALARVIRETQARLVLAGSGNHSFYRDLAQSLGIPDKVIFLGFVPEETLRLLYSSCDLFVLPSRLEGFGLVALEAMAAGKPVVATKVGSIPELIKAGQNGLLVQPGDENELAQAIIQLLSDSSLASSIGRNNLRIAKSHYSWQSTAQKTEQLYRECKQR